MDLPLKAIREQIASAVDLIVHQNRLKDGTRKIVNITEVQGMEGDVIVMQDIFVFEQTGTIEGKIDGQLRPTGSDPSSSRSSKWPGSTCRRTSSARRSRRLAAWDAAIPDCRSHRAAVPLVSRSASPMSGGSGGVASRLERYAG